MIEFAISYAEMGWKVFPLAPNTKIPLAGTRGFKDATNDLTKVRQWWTDNPTANIGLATGSPSGVWVIDIDQKKGRDGQASIKRFASGYELREPVKKVVKTPNGGEHWYVLHEEATEVGSRAAVLPGVDIRGNGGYVVLPPSKLPSGTYAWSECGADAQPAIATSWITALPWHVIGRDQQVSASGKVSKRDTSKAMSWDFVIQGKHAGLGRIRDLAIGKKYQCYCPFHVEQNISAFCQRMSEDFAFVYCSACDASWRTEPKEDADDRRISEINARLTVLQGAIDAK